MPLRNPVLALARRFMANQKKMTQQWEAYKSNNDDPEKLKSYIITLRRAQRLDQALDHYIA